MSDPYTKVEYIAASKLGKGARPTAYLRMLSDGKNGRLQQLWSGPYGEDWFDVPREMVGTLPPRSVIWPPKAESPAGNMNVDEHGYLTSDQKKTVWQPLATAPENQDVLIREPWVKPTVCQRWGNRWHVSWTHEEYKITDPATEWAPIPE